MPVAILIAEDDALLRELLTNVLTAQQDFDVVGGLGNGREVLDEVARLKPDILLLDLLLPGLPGLQVLDQLTQVEGAPKVLVVSGAEADETQLLAARHGAQGFIRKSDAGRVIAEAIRTVTAGGSWFAPRIVNAILRDYPVLSRQARERESPLARLTPREREVLACVARGMTNSQIAAQLYMSVSTVKVHLRKVLDTLGVETRTEAAIQAVREGLIEQERPSPH